MTRETATREDASPDATRGRATASVPDRRDDLPARGPAERRQMGDRLAPGPFPMSAEVAEKQLKKTVPTRMSSGARLIACRRDDGRPVGSARVDDSDPTTTSSRCTPTPRWVRPARWYRRRCWRSSSPGSPASVSGRSSSSPLTADLAGVARRRKHSGCGRRSGCVMASGATAGATTWSSTSTSILCGWPGSAIPVRASPRRRAGDGARAPAPRRDRRAVAAAQCAHRQRAPGAAPDAGRGGRNDRNLIRGEPDASFGHSRFPYSAVAILIGSARWQKDPPQDVEFAVVLRETGELIGENGLYDIDWLARTAESAPGSTAADRGQGYGTEAKLLLLEYAFERLGLNMIWAWVKARNPRSQAALRKQGYREPGVSPGAVTVPMASRTR